MPDRNFVVWYYITMQTMHDQIIWCYSTQFYTVRQHLEVGPWNYDYIVTIFTHIFTRADAPLMCNAMPNVMPKRRVLNPCVAIHDKALCSIYI